MVEIILAATQVTAFIAFLVFFFFREKHQESIDSRKQKFYVDAMTQSNELISQNFSAYLKHIQNLEKMVLPKAVSQKEVEDILNRTPPIVENEIDKVEDDPFGFAKEDSFAKVPINNETQVMFEEGEDMIETQVED